ncbi:sphingomyelin phosphodiesterase 4 isoform X2 [Phlebotomus argentipes]|uniref:sphingomyelin phosphodiesterase 4 isoform X2 n=1 Tax=Phlebotomus argentipes TaxID=94469 RepID=UPI0028929C4E|nr:sphingomyelin phosphodiesterase 4 isoform X2 [Phlebotomus argentipes]
MENFGNRFMEILSYPVRERCQELCVLIDHCSIKELQEVFPTLVHSIFNSNGGIGWGLRSVVANTYEFSILYDFFVPLGPMFRLCYKLLNDALKFDVPISTLPLKMRQMLESGRYPLFYSDIVNVDHFSRQVTSVSFNAFGFYMLHFALHGLIPMHKICPAAQRVHTENWKSVFFFLTADYLCTFLPKDPNEPVLPQNISGNIKVAQTIQISPVKPTRSPVYLKLSALTRQTPNPITVSRGVEPSSWTHAWRTETVLYIFTDAWLRFSVEDSRDLPSSEFIRLIRIFVKQGHLFANSADIDNTSVSQLRKLAQAMMNAQMNAFLTGIISRWPLDCSFMVVLELWLSYIQPWRYVFGREVKDASDFGGALLRFESFIQENLCEYTQIFIQLLPRFECLDLTSLKNVLMIFRLVKVFSQPNLVDVLSRLERSMISNANGFMPQRYSPTQYSPNKSANTLLDTSYMFMFHAVVRDKIQLLLRKIKVAEVAAREQNRLAELKSREETFASVWQKIKNFFTEGEDYFENALKQDKQRIPEILQLTAQLMADAFELELPEIVLPESVGQEYSNTAPEAFTSLHNDSSQGFSSLLSTSRSRIVDYRGDPDLMPIQSNEITSLARFLYQVSCKLNIMFGSDFQRIWQRNDIWGVLLRPLLAPPMVAEYIDKSSGRAVFREKYLGPRVRLRSLASYKTFFLIALAMFCGKFFFNSILAGVFLLMIFVLVISSVVRHFGQEEFPENSRNLLN